jgi:signal transduction histidine kinase
MTSDSGFGSGTTDGTRAARVVCVSEDLIIALQTQELVTSFVPGAEVDVADPSSVRGVPDADCIVVVPHQGATATALEIVRAWRSRGSTARGVIVAANISPEEQVEAQRLGVARVIETKDLAHVLPAALSLGLQLEKLALESERAAELLRSIRHAERLMAAGEIALHMQHSLNNPLAALIAEAQLLEMELLEPEHASSVQRMIELCRRVIGVTKALDGISAHK